MLRSLYALWMPHRVARGDGKAARRKRIFARLREGWAYDETARQDRVTGRRVRHIVSVGAGPVSALSRRGPTLRAAGEAVEEGGVGVIAALMKERSTGLSAAWRGQDAAAKAGARAANSPQMAEDLG
ncbi:MAG: hypothetical protein JO223_06610 [Hyphomicrobiales bacterium]|nr:hypothetical protein [Hyphomicrobiales bacterium]MBV8443945.1 hypothetical protein [Hyphomicrobiales bacterium]